MKLLMENWRKFLNEGMKMPEDLPDGIQVRTNEEGDSVSFKLVNQETGKEPTRDEQRDKFGRIYGEVWIRKYQDDKGNKCLNAWEIASSGVASGFGPMLYDLAMEYATANGGGLSSGRESVSEKAYLVWHKYNNMRDDVESVQLDNLENELTPGFDALKTREATPEENEDNCEQMSSYYWAKERGRPWKDTATARLYKKDNTEMYDKLKDAGKLYDETPI